MSGDKYDSPVVRAARDRRLAQLAEVERRAVEYNARLAARRQSGNGST